MSLSYRKPGELSMPLGKERRTRGVTGADSHPASYAPSANTAVKAEPGDAHLRRDRRHRPQSTLHDGAVTVTTPARTKQLPPRGDLASAWQRGWRCTLTEARNCELDRRRRWRLANCTKRRPLEVVTDVVCRHAVQHGFHAVAIAIVLVCNYQGARDAAALRRARSGAHLPLLSSGNVGSGDAT
jgi:hypothetical protein